jgi:energy-coupling factor transporter ATP-binding protein EcfA2
MEPHAHRQTVRQLADDLAWLENHCRTNSDLTVHAAQLRLAAALTRNVIGPATDGQSANPLFIAVIGGAGAGKSTVVNFLTGAIVADANPQAGFTRHPTAFTPSVLGASWPSHLGFLGPLQRLATEQPASLDQDVYQVKKREPQADDPLADFVIWDCPDMTTWASSNYVSRLMEVVALADVVVYVASDERYNDEVPTQFLHLVIQAGKPVVCCLTKMREADRVAIVEHFRKEVLEKLPETVGNIPTLPVVTIPNIPQEVRKDPAGLGARYRVPLLNQLLALVPTVEAARRRTVSNAVKYLESAGEGLLDVARRDLSELDKWRSEVSAGKQEFEQRYKSEYLSGEAFRRFDKTHEQVMQMLDLPGPGKGVSAGFALIRKPYGYIRDFVMKTVTRPTPPNLSEQSVCTEAMEAWLAKLQAEALRRGNQHALWKQVSQGFDGGLKTQATEQFGQKLRLLEMKETDELDQMARAAPEKLANNPVLLNILRGGIIALDILVIVLIVVFLWPPSWWWLIILPAVSLTRHLVELVVKLVIDGGRNKLKAKRIALVNEQLTTPLASWLGDWPTTSGSSLERLQLVLRRVPDTIRDLAKLTNRTETGNRTPDEMAPAAPTAPTAPSAGSP